MKIIGITGTLGAGKGTIVDFLLKNYDFKHFSVRNFLIEEIKNRNLDINRDNMAIVANDLRAKNGPSYIVEKLFEIAKKSKNDCIIESIRCPGEVEALKKNKDFILLAVDTIPKLRYERILKRNTSTDNISYDKFVEQENFEMENTNPNKQNLKVCIDQADYKLDNSGTFEDLYKQVENILKMSENKTEIKTEKRQDYISWDEYFMGLALLSAKRSKDPSTQVGACIVNQDNKVVGLGYNGFPIGCSDEDLPWCRDKDFFNSKYAYVVHAEANAILNSISNLKGCRLYVALTPCNECAKQIIQSGISEVVYLSDKYAEVPVFMAGKRMLKMAGVKLRQYIPENKQLILDLDIDKI